MEPGLAVHALDHLVLTVKDVEATVAFYAHLGFKPITFADGRVALRFGSQKINLHAVGAEIAPQARCPTPGSADLCFLVESTVGDVVSRLQRVGVAVELGPVDRVGATGPLTSVYVRDPDGNLIEFAVPSGEATARRGV